MNDTTVKDPTTHDANVDDGTTEDAAATSAAPATGVVDTVLHDDRGMSTIEYALGCVAAAALGALLYMVVTSDAVESALTSIFQRALDTE
ncbi:MAG TPA: DUF4244 domain-containing protein [Candidatus Corynebacterium avicola]|uniref:DUF4244 domain-containing protein n=1 Tax=Candidatus Corynebacterium avicola TaxID=2838527 RepID=A0A9D1UL93_9CORY|nr:DUF4244 domain-containing protein [Candidatus Corynebacterium avicola]